MAESATVNTVTTKRSADGEERHSTSVIRDMNQPQATRAGEHHQARTWQQKEQQPLGC